MSIKKSILCLYTVVVAIILSGFLAFIAFIVGCLECLLFLRFPRSGVFIHSSRFTRQIWAASLLFFFRVKVDVQGLSGDFKEKCRGRVVVMNHQSALDIPVCLKVFGEPIVFLSKKEILYIPIFGLGSLLSGVVFIDRKKGVKETSALDSIQRALRQGNAIAIYPEGTRSADGQLKELKRGAFVMAIEAGADVLPVTIVDSRKRLPKKEMAVHPGRIRVVVGEPISTQGMSLEDRYELSNRVRDVFLKNLDSSVN